MSADLKTERLLLRTITSDLLDDFHTNFSNPVSMFWSLLGPTKSKEDSLSRMQNYALPSASEPDRRSWLFYELDSAEPRPVIGSCALVPKERTGGSGTWEIGYSMLPDYMGKGYVTEGCMAAMQAVIEEFGGKEGEGEGNGEVKGTKKIVAWVGPRNPASVRVLEKLGLTKVKHQTFPGEPPVFVGGQWDTDGVYVFEKEF